MKRAALLVLVIMVISIAAHAETYAYAKNTKHIGAGTDLDGYYDVTLIYQPWFKTGLYLGIYMEKYTTELNEQEITTTDFGFTAGVSYLLIKMGELHLNIIPHLVYEKYKVEDDNGIALEENNLGAGGVVRLEYAVNTPLRPLSIYAESDNKYFFKTNLRPEKMNSMVKIGIAYHL